MKIPVIIQLQKQISGVKQVKEETLPKQKEGIQPPLTAPTTDRSIGHMPETHTMPDHTIRPNMSVEQVPF